MKIFLASASFDEIRWATSAGLADGVLVSSALIDSDIVGATARARALQIARSFPVPIILSLGTHDAGELYHEARDGMRETDHLILEFPFSADTADALHRAVENGVKVAASMIFTPAQALLAAKCGASAENRPWAGQAACGSTMTRCMRRPDPTSATSTSEPVAMVGDMGASELRWDLLPASAPERRSASAVCP
jgi:hypothetical protein